jgi:DNA-binding PadR family transcriptional regulator
MTAGNKELVGASTTLLILGVLRRGPNYGYDIVRQVNEAASGVFAWQEGSVYPLLHKLERNGLIGSEWREPESGEVRKRRKYYHLAPAGRAALQRGLDQWALFHGLVVRLAGASHA